MEAKILEKLSREEYSYFDLKKDFDDDYTRVERQNNFYGRIDPIDVDFARDALKKPLILQCQMLLTKL